MCQTLNRINMQVPREEEVYRLSLSSRPPCSSPPPPASPTSPPPRPTLHLGHLIDQRLPLTAPLLTLLAELVKPLTKLLSFLSSSSSPPTFPFQAEPSFSSLSSCVALLLLRAGLGGLLEQVLSQVQCGFFSGAVTTFLAFGWKVLWGSIIWIKCR